MSEQTFAAVRDASAARSHDYFPAALGAAIGVLSFAGFAPTFFARAVFAEAAPLASAVVAHGALGTAWLLLFVSQAVLAAADRLAAHRALGYGAALVGGAFVVVGAAVIAAFERGHAGEPPAFLAVHAFANGAPLLAFAALAGAGIANRRIAARHQRFMLLATVVLLPPALGRLLALLGAPPLGFPLYAAFAFAGALHDRRRDGRVHPVSLWGAMLLVAIDAATIGSLHWIQR